MKLEPTRAPEGLPLLTVYYDGQCALCRAEIDAVRRLDRDGTIAMVDCADPAFDDSRCRADGITRDAMLQALHARDALGDWHRGVDAIGLMYATAGAPRVARLWVHPWTRPIASRLYGWVVRHRYRLSALGLRRALHDPAPQCRDGRCSLDGRPGPAPRRNVP